LHQKLIAAGSTEKLTYRQLRRLEKMDRDKERERAVVQLVDTAIRAGGQAAEGAFAGAGLAMQGYLSGDAVAFAAKTVAGFALLEWLVYSYPDFAKLTHLDTYPGAPPKLPPTDNAYGEWGIRLFYFDGHNQWLAFDTLEQRSQAWSIITGNLYELLHGIAQVNAGFRSVLSGNDGPYSTESEAFLRISELAYKNIRSQLAKRADGWYVTYTPVVGPWT
jgi:hypothetical protein